MNAEEIATKAATLCAELGAEGAVILVAAGGIGVVTHGTDMIAVRGLLEVGSDVVRQMVVRDMTRRPAIDIVKAMP